MKTLSWMCKGSLMLNRLSILRGNHHRWRMISNRWLPFNHLSWVKDFGSCLRKKHRTIFGAYQDGQLMPIRHIYENNKLSKRPTGVCPLLRWPIFPKTRHGVHRGPRSPKENQVPPIRQVPPQMKSWQVPPIISIPYLMLLHQSWRKFWDFPL